MTGSESEKTDLPEVFGTLQTTPLCVTRAGEERRQLFVKPVTIIGKCLPQHRAREFGVSSTSSERNVPDDLDNHVIVDNASTHKTELISN